MPACGGASIRTMNSGTMDDATITARVKTALLNDPEIGAVKIDVATHDGVVTLSGSVPTKRDEARAVDLARRVQGVRDVVSQLRTEN